jgi:hypothetical protein
LVRCPHEIGRPLTSRSRSSPCLSAGSRADW